MKYFGFFRYKNNVVILLLAKQTKGRQLNLYRKLGIIGWPKNLQYALFGCLASGKNVLLTGLPGSNKTRFIRALGGALGKRTRIYDCDKLSTEVLMGELDPAFIGQTARALEGVSEAISSLKSPNSRKCDDDKPAVVKRMFRNGVETYEIIGWDEVLRAEPGTQQSLMLTTMQDKTFQGLDVKALQISCTNTGFSELFDFNEALLNRYHFIFECPHFSKLSQEDQEILINESGHNKVFHDFKPDKELIDVFENLQDCLDNKPSPSLDKSVKRFVLHLKYPLSKVLGDRMSGRAVDHISQVLYVALYSYCLMEKVKFSDVERRTLRDIMFDTFLCTLYLKDMSKAEITQVQNAFYHAFMHTFDVTKLTLKDKIDSVPSFWANCEDFTEHITNIDPDQQDIVGISVFMAKLKKECINNEPLRYILYKWFDSKVTKHTARCVPDELSTIRNKLSGMQSRMSRHIQSNSVISTVSNTLNGEFIQKIQETQGEKIFSSLERDPKLYESLVTVLTCFKDEEIDLSNEEYIEGMYTKLATLQNI